MLLICFRLREYFLPKVRLPSWLLIPSPADEMPLREEVRDLWAELVLGGHLSISKQLASNRDFGIDFVIDPEGGYVELGAGG